MSESLKSFRPIDLVASIKSYNWRLGLARVVINGVVLALIAWLLEGIHITGERMLTYFVLGLVFGLLNAFVKPIVQFLTLPFLFVTYGFVVILINAIMLKLLAFLMPSRMQIDGLWPALLGGAIVGILSTLIENVFGASTPIVDTVAGESDRLARVPTLPVQAYSERGKE